MKKLIWVHSCSAGVDWLFNSGCGEDFKKNDMKLTWEEPLGPFDGFYYYGCNSDGDALLPRPLAGLQSSKVSDAKSISASLLAPTDWYITKSTEVADYDVPANILSFRADVRSKSNEMETAIDNCSNVDELKALYEYTEQEDGSITRPLVEFPTLEI